MVDELNWLQRWFLNQCDGDWEHENQLKIETTSNPGWAVEISLADTKLTGTEFRMNTADLNEKDWWYVRIEKDTFFAAGDPTKLSLLLSKFKRFAETGDANLML